MMKSALPATALALAATFHAGAAPDQAAYFDPSDRRIHAQVGIEISGGQLQLHISATGARVEPLPGFRGRAGANLQTAFEIDQLIAGERLEVITTDRFGNRLPDGYSEPGQRGHLPVRTMSSDGTIDFDARSEQAYLLDLTTNGPALPHGVFRTELWARGEPRLRLDYHVDQDGNGRVLDFVELAHPENPPEDASHQFRFIDTKSEGAPGEPPAPPVDPAAWQKRDAEARWTMFKRSLDSGGGLDHWVSWLAAEKDFVFLEQIAMHEIDSFGTHGIGNVLKSAGAPNWLRLVIWMAENPVPRGHGSMVTDGLLYDEKQQDIISSWLRAHGLEKEHRAILLAFETEDPKPKKVDVSNFDPPHDPDKVLGLLDAPESLPRLEPEAESADGDRVYLHQVVRAIDALVVSGRYAKYGAKLEKLRRHPEARVRQAVYLAHTHMGSQLVPADTLAVTNDAGEDDLVREAALLAHSYRAHFEIYTDLIEIAGKPAHPAWSAAVSRLGDLGDGYASDLLGDLQLDDPAQLALATSSRDTIDLRLKTLDQDRPISIVWNPLQRAAWMKTVGDDREGEYREWLDSEVKKHIVRLRPELAKLADTELKTTYGPAGLQAERSAALTGAIRELIKGYAKSP